MKYVCEKCGTVFYNQSDCSSHEEYCNSGKVKVKAIGMLDCDVYVAMYNNAFIAGRMIDLILGGSVKTTISKEKFDKIHENDGRIIFYTINMSKEYENKIIKEIISRRINSLNNEKRFIENKIEELKSIASNQSEEKINKINDLLIDEL